MSWIIYKHTSPEGKSYIGQTCQKNINQRWRDGKGYNENHQPLFRNAINKYGWDNFKHEILEENIATLNEANEREKYYIDFFRTYIGFGDCNGYNMTPGGDSKGGAWFEDEDEIIFKYYPIEGQECYKRLTNRTKSQVRGRAQILGVHSEIDTYSKEDDEIISQFYPLEGSKVANRLKKKHSKSAINQRAIKLGLKYDQNLWSDAELELLKNNYETVTFEDMQKLLPNRTIGSIKSMARRIGLNFKKKTSWSTEEDAALKQLFPVFGRTSYKYISGRSLDAVVNRARILKLRKQHQQVIVIEINKVLTLKEAEKLLKVGHSNIIRACKNTNKTAGGYHFCYKEDTTSFEKLKHFIGSKKKITHRKVISIDSQGNSTFYDSVCDAIKETGVRHVSECCSGKLKTAGGYRWMYVDE